MEVYAPEDQQPPLPDKDNLELLSPGEKEIVTFFEVESNVEKLIHFLSLEDRKGKDKFDATRFSLFKGNTLLFSKLAVLDLILCFPLGLFRNFGDLFLVHFRPHLERLVRDQNEASQRCAAEIITGLIRGSKHWTFSKTEAMWNFLCPLLRTAFSNVNVESINDWGTAIATASESRDPNRISWLMELILEDHLEQVRLFKIELFSSSRETYCIFKYRGLSRIRVDCICFKEGFLNRNGECLSFFSGF